MNYCPHCGARIEHDGKFCQSCGKPLEAGTEAKTSVKQSFSQLKDLIPNRENFNQVIRFMHANFFLVHAIYLVVFIITLISSWSGLWALLLSAIGIYLFAVLQGTDEHEWNKQVKEMIMAVGENRPVEPKKAGKQAGQANVNETVTPATTVYPEETTPEADTFDQLDVAADVVVEPEVEGATVDTPLTSEAATLDTEEAAVEADIEAALDEELDELEALNDLERVEDQATLDEIEQLDEVEVIVASEGEADVLLHDTEEKKF